MTFDVDKLTSINISSTGSPVIPVTYNFEQGHRHTLLVWAPNNYRVVSSWTPTADSLLIVVLETQPLRGVTLFYPMWYYIR